MKYVLAGHDFRTAAEEILITLFPGDRPEKAEWPRDAARFSFQEFRAALPELQAALPPGERAVCSFLRRTEKTAFAESVFFAGGAMTRGARRVAFPPGASPDERRRQCSYAVRESIYRAALPHLPAKPPWGSMTGVRPAKLAAMLLTQTGSGKEAMGRLARRYHVSPLRGALAVACGQKGLGIKAAASARDICLYVAIPFCPTRCNYCSFVSHSVEKAGHLIPPYLDMLEKEMAAAAEAAAAAGLKIRAVYIGGGTPTVLSAPQLARLTSRLRCLFDIGGAAEYTVEAGRPDTIDEEKLFVLRENGANRISVNPQSMNPKALAAAGRPHTPEDIVKAYHLTGKAGFSVRNMDVIAGLPEDAPADFSDTLEKLLALRPENLTIHTLSYKKGSFFRQEGGRFGNEAVGAMLKGAYEALPRRGYAPYYLYRQKYMAGGYENTGWCLPGTESLYNIVMMEELFSVLALGAGGVTKYVDAETGEVRRLMNPKFPYEYLMAEEKLRRNCRDFGLFYASGKR